MLPHLVCVFSLPVVGGVQPRVSCAEAHTLLVLKGSHLKLREEELVVYYISLPVFVYM